MPLHPDEAENTFQTPMIKKNIIAPSLALLFMLSLAGCDHSASAPASQTAAATAKDTETRTALNDSAMYIGDKFADAEQRLAEVNTDLAPPAPTF